MISNVRQGQRITAQKTNEIIDAVNTNRTVADRLTGKLDFNMEAVPDGVAFDDLEVQQIPSNQLSNYSCGQSIDQSQALAYDGATQTYVEREVVQLHNFSNISSDYQLSTQLTGDIQVVCREILQDSNNKKYGEIKYVDLSALGSEGGSGKGGLPGTFEIVYGVSNELSLINCALPIATKWFFYDDQALTSLTGEYFITLKVDLYDDPPGISCQCEDVQPWVFSDQRLSNIVYVPLYKMNGKTVLCDYKNNVHIQAFQNYS